MNPWNVVTVRFFVDQSSVDRCHGNQSQCVNKHRETKEKKGNQIIKQNKTKIPYIDWN